MRWSSRGHCVFRLYSVCKRLCVWLLPPAIGQPRAAGAPPEAASSLPEKQAPPSISPAAPRRGISLRNRLLPPSINPAAPRSGSFTRNKLLPPAIEQPRAAGAPPKTSFSLPPSSSPAQRELPQKQPLLSINTAAPRSGSSLRNRPFLHQSSSPAQRELPQTQPLLSLYQQAAPRSGSSTRNRLLPLSIGQPPRSGKSPRISLFSPSIRRPCTAGAPLDTASSLPLSSSPAQRELPQK